MGKILPVKPVKLFIGFIASSESALNSALKAAEENWGRIDVRSAVIPFDFTDYYEKEMGAGLLRRWAAFEKLIDPGELSGIKVKTNLIEGQFAAAGGRAVNIDPGYIELSKTVLASTKDFSHRVYIGDGIYAEITLMYGTKRKCTCGISGSVSNGAATSRPHLPSCPMSEERRDKWKEYTALPWTYPDYQTAEAKKFLNECRDKLKTTQAVTSG